MKKYVFIYSNWFLVPVGIFLSLIILEVLSFTVIHGLHFLVEKPTDIERFAFHPLFRSEGIPLPEKGDIKYAPRSHPIFGWLPAEYSNDTHKKQVDRYGFRDNGDSGRVISTDEINVFLVGGSTAFGNGIKSNEKTISAQLERLIRGQYPGANVINAGISGYYSALELLRIQNELVFFSPKLIISLSGSNDAIVSMSRPRPSHFESATGNYYLSPRHVEVRNFLATRGMSHSVKELAKNLITALSSRTYAGYVLTRFAILLSRGTYNLQPPIVIKDAKDYLEWRISTLKIPADLQRWRNTSWNFFMKDISPEEKKVLMDTNIEHYLTYIKMTKGLLTACGVNHVFALQPILATENRELNDRERSAKELVKKLFSLVGDDVETTRNYFLSKVKIRLNEEKVEFLDLRQVFPPRQSVYADHIHYNELGAEFIANAMFDYIIDKGLLNGGSSRCGSSADRR